MENLALTQIMFIMKRTHFDETFLIMKHFAIGTICTSQQPFHTTVATIKRLLLIWSRTHSVPGHLVPHIWSPRTNSPGSFGPPGQMVPKTIGPLGQLVPKHLVPMDKWSPRQLVPLDKWFPKLVPMDNWSPKFIISFQKRFGTFFKKFRLWEVNFGYNG